MKSYLRLAKKAVMTSSRAAMTCPQGATTSRGREARLSLSSMVPKQKMIITPRNAKLQARKQEG
jgi:hypothetical protein